MNGRRRGIALVAGGVVIALAVLVGGFAYAQRSNSEPKPAGDVGIAAPVLLSQGKPTLASSSGGCCPPNLAVDGNSATRWASGSGVDPQWIRVDLGVTAQISRVRLQWDLSCATAYRIETSPNGSTWTSIFSTSTGDGGVDDLTVSGSGRYVRMFGTARCRTEPQYGYSLQEYQVFGETGTGDTSPPTRPGAPTLVSVTSSSATIRWGASTDNVGVVDYQIFRDGQHCATVTAPAVQGTCSGLSANQEYGFYVTARDAAGNVSPDSATLSVTTPPSNDTQPPTAPTNLRLNGTVTSTSIPLAWNAATDNVGVVRYTVYRDRTNQLGTATGTTTTLNGLTGNTTYRLTVRASDANGNEGPHSNEITVTTPSGGCTQPVCGATELTRDNDVVWGMVNLPDGTVLYARRDAHNITRWDPATGAKTNVGTVPNTSSTDGEGGLMGLEIAPGFAGRWLYIMHTSPNDNRVIRMRLTSSFTLDTGSLQVLVSGIRRATFHNGGRLRWGPQDNMLYAATGDGQQESSAQSTSSLNGKILRINPEGGVPSGNPFNNFVWSYGHRNPQGLAFDSQGRLWQQEFGNSVMDETNLVVRGGNYGWPQCEGTSSRSGQGCSTPGFIAPKRTYPVASGSCSGIAIVRGALYVACLRGARMYRMVISGDSLTNQQTFFQGTFGRLRTVEPSPDGNLWLATSVGGDKDSTPNNSNNRIFRVTLGG
ncbi:MAG TPA: PQQ-dependent sugar dehydrogenase [Pilimelia sp.]|nr:PQQ-dependent sugar dehydrogenase [Pilimelia sp.]